MDDLNQEYIVQGTLMHNGQSYADGTKLPPGFFTDAQEVAALRHFKAIMLPAETLPAANLQDQLNAQQAENATLRERLAALEAQQQSATFPESSEA